MKEKLSLRRYRYLFLLMSAALMGLTLIFPGKLGALQWVAFVPLIIAFNALIEDERMTAFRIYGYGVAFFMMLYIVVYHWFWVMYPLDFTGLSEFYALCVILLACLGLPLLASVAGGFTFVVAYFVKRTAFFKRFKFLPFLAFAIAYAAFDFSQTLTFAGVPWGRLPIGQTGNSIILSSVSFFGSYFLTFAIVLCNAALGYVLIYKKKAYISICAGTVAVVCLLGTIGYSLSFLGEGETVKAAAIQGNMASAEKWGEDSFSITIERYTRQTELAMNEGATFIVWPESVFPFSIRNRTALNTVNKLTGENDIYLFYGALDYGESGDGHYNVLGLSHGGKVDMNALYYKRKLVPFGEYVPMREFVSVIFPMLSQVSMLADDVVPGEDSRLFDTEYGKVGGMICFDSIYEDVALDAVRDGAELLVLGTNDSWFYDSAAGYMHNAQAQIRACEVGRGIVRSANTGVSSIINARGEILDLEEALREGYAIGEVTFRDTKTLYVIIGDLFAYLASAVSLSTPVIYIVGRKLEKKSGIVI